MLRCSFERDSVQAQESRKQSQSLVPFPLQEEAFPEILISREITSLRTTLMLCGFRILVGLSRLVGKCVPQPDWAVRIEVGK